ncbi:MAG: RNA polymerase sigma-70 factor [Proteiniphilum sp.]
MKPFSVTEKGISFGFKVAGHAIINLYNKCGVKSLAKVIFAQVCPWLAFKLVTLYITSLFSHPTGMKHDTKEESSSSEKQLFKEISEGNERAFQLIFTRYYPRMISFADKMVKSPHVAEEIVQEAFIRLWEQRELLTEIKNPENYFFIVIRNHALNYLRAAANELKRREQLWDAMEQRAVDGITTMEMEEADQFFEKILEKLSPQQRKIFRMSREEGFSHQQIADELHLSKNTVKKHMAESLKIFKASLKYFKQIILS